MARTGAATTFFTLSQMVARRQARDYDSACGCVHAKRAATRRDCCSSSASRLSLLRCSTSIAFALPTRKRRRSCSRADAGRALGRRAVVVGAIDGDGCFGAVRRQSRDQWSRSPPIPAADLDSLIARGVAYLAGQQNTDGGFGDKDLSHSNIATTYLVVAALHLAGATDEHRGTAARPGRCVSRKQRAARGLRERYGIDKTFVVPIMTNLAIAGLLDCARSINCRLNWRPCRRLVSVRRDAGRELRDSGPRGDRPGPVPPRPPWNPLTRLVRWLSITRSLKVLRRMQPDSGGYLEATPLTSFVVMSLASCGPMAGGPLAPQADDSRGNVNPAGCPLAERADHGVADQVFSRA